MTGHEQWVPSRRLAHAWTKIVRHLLVTMERMAGLQCVCGDVFRAQCDIEPASCGVAYLLLVLSAIAHVMRCCAWCDDEDSDDEECTSTMYT